METREEAVALMGGLCTALEARGVECSYEPTRATLVFSEDSGGLYVFVGTFRGKWSVRVNVPGIEQPKSYSTISGQDTACEFIVKERARLMKIEAEEEAAEEKAQKLRKKAAEAYEPPKTGSGALPDELDGFEVCKSWRTDKHGDDPMGIFEELEGRGARCSCGRIYKSAHNLPFFQFRGEGSEAATSTCHCGYYAVAHTDSARHPITDHQFEARGAYEFDEYYCGCRGWD